MVYYKGMWDIHLYTPCLKSWPHPGIRKVLSDRQIQLTAIYTKVLSSNNHQAGICETLEGVKGLIMCLLIPRTVFLIWFLEFPNKEERALFPGAIGSIVLLCRLMGYLLKQRKAWPHPYWPKEVLGPSILFSKKSNATAVYQIILPLLRLVVGFFGFVIFLFWFGFLLLVFFLFCFVFNTNSFISSPMSG